MKDKGILPKTREEQIVPVSAATVNSYLTNGHPLPDITSPKLQWGARWNTDWNDRVRSMLVDDFVQEVKDDKYPPLEYNKELLDPKVLMKSLTDKLNHLKKRFINQEESRASEEGATKVRARVCARSAMNRRGGRRHGVLVFHL